MELLWSAIDLRCLLKNSLNIVKENARKHQISLSLHVQDLPETIKADERKLKQVLYSLLYPMRSNSRPTEEVWL